MFVVVITTARHSKYSRLQIVAHQMENQAILDEALAGRPPAKKGKSADILAVHASSGSDLHSAAYYTADCMLFVEPATEEERAVPKTAFTAPHPCLSSGAPYKNPIVTHEPREVSPRAAMYDAMLSSFFSGELDPSHAVEHALEDVEKGKCKSIEEAGAARGVQRIAWPVLVPWREATRQTG